MTYKAQLFVFIQIFLAVFFLAAEDEAPFEATVEISQGRNVIDWESTVFGEKKPVEEPVQEEENKTEEIKKEELKQKDEGTPKAVKEELPAAAENITEAPREAPQKEVKKEEEYNPSHPKWGEYYGVTPRYDYPLENEKESEKKTAVKTEKEVPAEIKTEDEGAMFPVGVILSTNHDTEFDAMFNTGIKVSYANIYSVLSVGTIYNSASLHRPLSLGVSAGGFYRISDFSINAGFDYRKVWDFGGDHDVNDYSLGLEAGVSYSIFDWLSVGAGAGVNYSVFKDSDFTDGKFIPTFFGALEFSLIR